MLARARVSLDRAESSGKSDTVARYGAPPKKEARRRGPSGAGAQGEGPAEEADPHRPRCVEDVMRGANGQDEWFEADE